MVITKPTVDDFSDTTVMRVIRKIVEYIIDTLVPAINEGGGGSSYVLPPATKSTLGGIIVGDNLTVDGSGKVNAPTPYKLPIGGTNIGGVKNGGNVTIDAQGNMNAPTTPAYTLPVASATTLGGVKIGSGVSVGADGTISVSASSNVTIEEINISNLPTDFKIDDILMIEFNLFVSSSTGSWQSKPDKPTIGKVNNPQMCLITIPSISLNCYTPILIRSQLDHYIGVIGVCAISPPNTWNDSSNGDERLIVLEAYAFNGAGCADASVDITRNNINTYISKMYRIAQ